jgi:hypothetical protein
MTDFDITTRSGLPEALQVLLVARPRDGWTGDPGFDGLARFWMERHMMFRELLDRLQADARGFVDGQADPQAYARHARLGACVFHHAQRAPIARGAGAWHP